LKIETTHQLINSNQETIFNFLIDLNNFEQLFPQDKIEDWNSTDETCTFKIKSMGTIGLKKVASTPNSLIYLDSYGKTPFKFTLNIYLSEKENNTTEAYLLFEGDINPFMKMMVEKPLTEFFNKIVIRLAKIHSPSNS
jgi:carbon monoxide dehydrogenase subunit G